MRLRVLELPADQPYVLIMDEAPCSAEEAQQWAAGIKSHTNATGVLIFVGRVEMDSDAYLPTRERNQE